MRFFILCFLVMAAALPAQAQPVLYPQENIGVFRNFVWGATQEDVKEFETARYYKTEGDSLYFVELPPAKDAFDVQFRRLIRYDFQNNKLFRARYEFQELTDPDPNRILNMHEDFKLSLDKIYGTPAREDYFWKEKTYRNYPNLWGRPLSTGDLRLETEWDLPDTKVVLELFSVTPYYELAYTAEKITAASESARTGTILDAPVDKPAAPKAVAPLASPKMN